MSISGDHTTVLSTHNLEVGFSSKKKSGSVLLSNLNTSLKQGELACLIGVNGSGKSTLIRTLAGLHLPLRGDVCINNRQLNSYTRHQLAKQVSIVLTDKIDDGNLSVFELVSLGRYPYLNWHGKPAAKDEEVIRWAIEKVGIDHLTHRNILELSDGERQKSIIARALAQDTPLMLLDEPTAHLDLPNRVSILSLLRKLAKDTQKAILLSTHELEMALQIADHLWLIDNQKSLRCGTTEDLVLDGSMTQFFENEMVRFDPAAGAFKVNHPVENQRVFVKGDDAVSHWTKQALEKEGFAITSEDSDSPIRVDICGTPPTWTIITPHDRHEAETIKQVKHIVRNGKKLS